MLAYAGAALPVLLIFSTQDTGFLGAINRENVAEEVVATLVGCWRCRRPRSKP